MTDHLAEARRAVDWSDEYLKTADIARAVRALADAIEELQTDTVSEDFDVPVVRTEKPKIGHVAPKALRVTDIMKRRIREMLALHTMMHVTHDAWRCSSCGLCYGGCTLNATQVSAAHFDHVTDMIVQALDREAIGL